MQINENDCKKAILKTAILVQRDRDNQQRIAEIKKKKETELNQDEVLFLRDYILRKKISQKSTATEDAKRIFRSAIIKNINGILDGAIQEYEAGADPWVDLLIQNFVDLTDKKSAYESVIRDKTDLLELITKESFLLQVYVATSNLLYENSADKIKERFSQNESKSDDIIFEIIGILYPKLIFGRLDLAILQNRAADEKKFFCDAGNFCTIEELCNGIKEIPQKKFDEHSKRGDFSKWIQNVFNDAELAKFVASAKSKTEFIETVQKYARNVEDLEIEMRNPDILIEIAAELFLNNIKNKDLLRLVPFLASKEEVKLLKLVDIYVEQNKSDQFKAELVEFLLNPVPTIEKLKKEPYNLSIDENLDFAECFRLIVQAKELLSSSTSKKAEEMIKKYESADIIAVAELDDAHNAIKEFEKFTEQYKISFPSISEKVGMAKMLLDNKITKHKDKVNEESVKYSKLCKEANQFIAEVQSSLDQKLFDKISLAKTNRAALEKFEKEKPTVDESEVPELKAFLDKSSTLSKLAKEFERKLKKKFDAQNNSIKNRLCSKKWSTLQDIEELQQAEKLWEPVFNQAKEFYDSENSDILGLPAEISKIKTKYEQESSEKKGKMRLATDYLRTFPGMAQELIADFNKIKNTDFTTIKSAAALIKSAKRNTDALREDTGFKELIAEFDTVLPDAEKTMVEIKQCGRQKLDTWLSEVSGQIDNTPEFSQYSYETWPAVCSRIEKLTSLAEIVGYDKKKLAAATAKADEKKAKVEQILEERTGALVELDKKIDDENTENHVEELLIGLSHTALSAILERIDSWKSEMGGKIEWEKDFELDAQIIKIKNKITTNEANTKNVIIKTINDTYTDMKTIGGKLSKAEKKTLMDHTSQLSSKKTYLENMSAGEFAAKTSKGIKEAQAFIEKAKQIRIDYLKGIDSEITAIDAAVSKDYDLSTDKKTLESSLAKISALIEDAKDLEYSWAEQKLNETKATASGKITKIDGIVNERRTALNRLIEEQKKQFSKFVNARKESITDSEIIDVSDELIKSMFNALQKQDRCKDDTELAPLHEQADAEIWNYFADALKHVESRIHSLDAFVKEKEKFAEKETLTITESKALVKIPTELEEYKKKYCAFDRTEVKNKEYLLFDVQGIKANTITAKLKYTDSVISKAQGRVKAITEDLTAKFKGIESFAKCKFEYTQEIPGLTSKKTELQKLNEFITAMGLNLLVKKVSNDIDEQITSIMAKSAAKQKVLEGIIQNTKEKQGSTALLLKPEELTHNALLKSYVQLGQLKKEISEKISESYCNDDALKEICAGISSDAAGLQDSIEKRIILEVEKLESKIKGNILFIDSAKLTSLQNLRAVMEAERNILSAQEKYKDIEEYAKLVLEKNKRKSTILEQKSKASQKINALMQKLAEKISSIDAETKKEFEYSQEIESLDSWKKELNDAIIPYITELKSDLPAEALVSRINEKIDGIQKKFAQKSTVLKEVDAFITDKQDKINALITGSSLDDKMIEQSYALWNSVYQEINGKITKAYEKDDALNPECKSIKQNKGKILNLIDARILQEAKKLDETVINKFNFINDTDIDSPEILSKILEADKQLIASQDSYRKIQKYAEPVLKHNKIINRTLAWQSPLGKVNTLIEKKHADFFEIEKQLQNNFEYSQEINKLVKWKDQLKEMSPYLQVLESGLPIDDVLKKTKEHALAIMQKRRQKKAVLTKINKDIANKKQIIEQLVAEKILKEDTILQCHGLLDSLDKDIAAKVTNLYLEDDSLKQKCADTKNDAGKLRIIIERRKLAEMTALERAISEKLKTIQDIEISSPKDIRTILEREQELLEAQAHGDMILKYAPYTPACFRHDRNIWALVSQKSLAKEKIETKKTDLSEEFSKIEKAVSGNFEYTQEIRNLNTYSKRMTEMSKYFAELGMLEAPAGLVMEKISKHTAGIRQKLKQKKQVLAEINKTITENKAGLKEIAGQVNLTEETLAQGKELVDSAETKICMINETYEKEQRLKQKCENARRDVYTLRRIFENSVVDEIKKLNSHTDAHVASITDITDIDSRRKIKTILKADSKISDIKEKYAIVTRYAAKIKDAPIKKEIISPAQEKIKILAERIDKEMIGLEKLLGKKYEYSQDAKFLHKEKRKVKKNACLYALIDKSKFEKSAALHSRFKERIAELDAEYEEGEKILSGLYQEACGHNELIEVLWQDILGKDNLSEAASMIKNLDDTIKAAKSLFNDEKLKAKFSQKIYNEQKELEKYHTDHIHSVAGKHEQELNTLLKEIEAGKTDTVDALKGLKKQEANLAGTKQILVRFKESSFQHEMNTCFAVADRVSQALEAKYADARSRIDSEYNLLKTESDAEKYKFTQQLPDLKNKKDAANKNIQLCEVISHSRKADLENLVCIIDAIDAKVKENYENWAAKISSHSEEISKSGKEAEDILIQDLDGKHLATLLEILANAKKSVNYLELNTQRQDTGLAADFKNMDGKIEQVEKRIDCAMGDKLSKLRADANSYALDTLFIKPHTKQELVPLWELRIKLENLHGKCAALEKGKYKYDVELILEKINSEIKALTDKEQNYHSELENKKQAVGHNQKVLSTILSRLESEKNLAMQIHILAGFGEKIYESANTHEKFRKEADEAMNEYLKESANNKFIENMIKKSAEQYIAVLSRLNMKIQESTEFLIRPWQTKQDIGMLKCYFREKAEEQKEIKQLKSLQIEIFLRPICDNTKADISVFGQHTPAQLDTAISEYGTLFRRIAGIDRGYKKYARAKEKEISDAAQSIEEFDKKGTAYITVLPDLPEKVTIEELSSMHSELKEIKNNAEKFKPLGIDKGFTDKIISLEDKVKQAKDSFKTSIQNYVKKLVQKTAKLEIRIKNKSAGMTGIYHKTVGRKKLNEEKSEYETYSKYIAELGKIEAKL